MEKYSIILLFSQILFVGSLPVWKMVRTSMVRH
jgi:hypothetical protein